VRMRIFFMSELSICIVSQGAQALIHFDAFGSAAAFPDCVLHFLFPLAVAERMQFFPRAAVVLGYAFVENESVGTLTFADSKRSVDEMRASFTLLSIAALCGVLYGEEKSDAGSLTVRFRLPKGLAADPGIFHASLLPDKGRQRLAPLKLAESPTNEDPWFTATFTRTPERKNAVLGFPMTSDVPMGTIFRPLAPGASEVTVDIPFTFYPANWEIPDALSKKLDLSSNAGRTFLTIRKVIEEKSFGTIYHPQFYVSVQLRKNIKDELYDRSFGLPFVDPGIYEFGVVTGPSHGKEILRRRVRLEPGKGLDPMGEKTLLDMYEAAKKMPPTRFEEADIVPRSVFLHGFNFDFDKDSGTDEVPDSE
jgi:hypothetical protein